MNGTIAQAEAFAREIVRTRFPSTLTYHSIDHIREVAEAVNVLAREGGLTEEDSTALQVAAWFHDLGFAEGKTGHEQRSAEMARDFLTNAGLSPNVIELVQRLVLATRADAPATSPLEEMMKDADVSHIGRGDLWDQAERLRQEVENTDGSHVKKKAWIEENIAFLERTPFRSPQAKRLWNEGRERNLNTLRTMLDDHANKKEKEHERTDPKPDKVAKKAAKAEAAKRKETERGVETMFRVTLNNHTRLSQIADNKANMMLSVNALIISVVLTGLGPKLDNNTPLLLPAGLLMGTCLLSIITATLATRPKVTHGTTSRQEIEKRKANLLFFGNFHNMELEDFEWGMHQLMQDRDYLYGSMTRDLYFLGRVLHKKYRFLHLTYTIFMIGICAAVLATIYSTWLMDRAIH